jgi:uncharacterized phage protein (TIGR02218 family)
LTYDAREISPYFGAPFELFWFATADHDWKFTSSDHAITYRGCEYQPEAITRTQSNQTTVEGGRVTLPVSNPVVEQFVAFSADTPMFLVIYRGHEGDSDVVVNFTGRVNLCRFGDVTAELNCLDDDVLKGRVPTKPQFPHCNHSLYDSACKVNRELFALQGTIATVDATGAIISVEAAASKADGWFTSGFLETKEQRRIVLLHAGDTMTLIAPLIGGAKVGDAVTLYAGCARDVETCKTKFNNRQHFGGFPWIPAQNPFKSFR